jgi:hypothetical protein
MDFKDSLKQLGERVIKLKDSIKTEEATKNALIMPFIQCLGYDVFNPVEVVPEFVSDIGIKKGEKIDYAILKDGEPTILIECKHWEQNLDIHESQLIRYFNVSKAKFSILTNGILYRFYTDLEEPNKMDEKPFFEFDITEMKDIQVEELKKFHKSYFEIDKIVATASELKYTKEIKSLLNDELKNPTPAYVKHFLAHVYNGKATEKVLTQFTELVKMSAQQLINDIITDRLKTALKENEKNQAAAEAQVQEAAEKNIDKDVKRTATVEELESYFLVKSLIRTKIQSSRISYRVSHSYFAIILDDTNRKTVCRLYLIGSKKHIGIFDTEKKEIKTEIQSLDDIYQFSTQLETVVDFLENKNTTKQTT